MVPVQVEALGQALHSVEPLHLPLAKIQAALSRFWGYGEEAVDCQRGGSQGQRRGGQGGRASVEPPTATGPGVETQVMNTDKDGYTDCVTVRMAVEAACWWHEPGGSVVGRWTGAGHAERTHERLAVESSRGASWNGCNDERDATAESSRGASWNGCKDERDATDDSSRGASWNGCNDERDATADSSRGASWNGCNDERDATADSSRGASWNGCNDERDGDSRFKPRCKLEWLQ